MHLFGEDWIERRADWAAMTQAEKDAFLRSLNYDERNNLCASGVELAAFLSITPRRVQQLAMSGFIPRAGRDQYPVIDSVEGYAYARNGLPPAWMGHRWRPEPPEAKTK